MQVIIYVILCYYHEANTINIASISVSGLVYLQIVILIVALYIKMEGER